MTKSNQYASALACKIVREQFGEAAEQVTGTLLRCGMQPLREVLRETCCPQLPPPAVKQALLVLVQHNCVDVYLEPADPHSKAPRSHLYHAQLSSIVQSIRKPKFLLHVKEELGAREGDEEKGVLAEAILEELLTHGRLRLDQVVSAVAARGGREGDNDYAARVRHMFMSLVHSHYIERAPLATVAPPLLRAHPTTQKRAKASKPGSKEWADEQAAAAKRLEDAAYQGTRFKLPAESVLAGLFSDDEDGGEDGERDTARAGSRDAGSSGAAAAVVGKRKRRRMLLDDDEEEDGGPEAGPATKRQATGGDEAPGQVPVLWRVNVEEFNRRFRHRVCADMVADKIDKEAGAVVAVMMGMGRSSENQVQEEQTMRISEGDVEHQVGQAISKGILEPLDRDVTEVLRVVANDSLELVSYQGEGPGGSLYTVNMGRIMDLVRLKQLEAVVRNRFGVPGLRVWRLMILRGQLEQKQIADLAMMPQKDTRELLYRMLKGGFVQLQDIPKTSDHAPSRTFYTWRASITAASEKLAVDLFRAADNIRARLEFEMERERELLDIVDAARDTGALAHGFTAAQKQRLQRLQQVSQTMDSRLLQLDDMLAIFNDF